MTLSYAAIAHIEERRQALGTAEIADEFEEIAGGHMTFGGKGSWMNQAVALGLDGPVSDAELDRLVEFYVSRGVEPRLELSPFADESLVTGLAQRGFTVRGFENVLAREIGAAEDLRAALPNGWPEGVEMVAVDPCDDDQVQVFAEVSSSGFLPAGEPVPGPMREAASRTVRHRRCDAYLACVDGRPVGAAAMETGHEGAGLFGTSVLPEYRRRGIQQTLIVRRLERARERGCRLAVIHSKPGIPTERNAARIGFFMAYSKVVVALAGAGLEPSP